MTKFILTVFPCLFILLFTACEQEQEITEDYQLYLATAKKYKTFAPYERLIEEHGSMKNFLAFQQERLNRKKRADKSKPVIVNNATGQNLAYAVNLRNSHTGLDVEIWVPTNRNILEVAKDAGIAISPNPSQQGKGSVHIAKIIEGEVAQSEQKILDEDEVKAGFISLDNAYPRSNLVIIINQEEELNLRRKNK